MNVIGIEIYDWHHIYFNNVLWRPLVQRAPLRGGLFHNNIMVNSYFIYGINIMVGVSVDVYALVGIMLISGNRWSDTQRLGKRCSAFPIPYFTKIKQ